MSHNPRLAINTYTNGRVTSIQTDEGTTNYSYACQSNVSQISKGSESFSFTYDGTLLTSIVQSGQLNQTIDYTYDNDFTPTSMTYANQTENYTYNDDNEPTQIGDYTITRKQKNRKVIISDGNYRQVTKINKYGELKKQEDNSIKVKLFRNQLGQIVKKVESYTYDSNGNRQSATVHGTAVTASYTLDDNLVVYGDNTYLYDDDGYLTEKTTPNGTTTYSYGTLGELLKVITPNKTITYRHNANNQRVAKLIGGVVVEKYLWADLTTLLATYDANDTIKQRFEYADGRMPVAMTDANNTKYYLHYDQVGSLRAISDIQMNIVKEITYDTFGNILTDSNPSFKVPFGFAGGLYDEDTKLTRFGYRDYDAYVGKWTAKDPIGFDGGDSNLYGYVLGDPVSGFDSSGLDPDKDKIYHCGSWNPSDLFHSFNCANGKCTGLTITNLYGGGILKDDTNNFDKYNKNGNCEEQKANGKDCNNEVYKTCMINFINQQGSTTFGYDTLIRNCKTWSLWTEYLCRQVASCD